MGLKKKKKEELTKHINRFSDEETTKFEIEEGSLKTQLSESVGAPATIMLLAGIKDFVGFSWSLDNEINTLGRSSRMTDICIPHDSVSKTHCQFIRSGWKFYIKDLASTNKTCVNERELTPGEMVEVKNNSRVRCGNVIFKFLGEGSLESFSTLSVFEKSQKDALTGVGNREALNTVGAQYFDLSVKTHQHLSLVVFDIDHFKKINDTYGHTAGDKVLKMIADLVSHLIREKDRLFRCGGEEFCLFTHSTEDEARAVAERIRRTVERTVFSFKSQAIRTTVSVGISCLADGDAKWEDIFLRADKALYKAKDSGRNKIVLS